MAPGDRRRFTLRRSPTRPLQVIRGLWSTPGDRRRSRRKCSASKAACGDGGAVVRGPSDSCGWRRYGIPVTTIVANPSMSNQHAAFVAAATRILPRHATECRRRGAALSPHGGRACATGGGRPQGGRADGQPAARQRRRADHVRPGDRARTAADALVRAVSCRAGRSHAAQPHPRHGERHHERLDQHGHHQLAVRSRRPSAFAAAAATIDGCRRAPTRGPAAETGTADGIPEVPECRR